jgi:hypothetical protein
MNHQNETCWIIGKGPSLEKLTKRHIGKGPVIAINESVVKVVSLNLKNLIYFMHKDFDLEPCIIENPDKVILLTHAQETPDKMPEYKKRHVFNNKDYGLHKEEFSSLVAGAIANQMGCRKVIYVSHDGCVNKDTRTCLYKPDGSYEIETQIISGNYLAHRQRIDTFLNKINMPVEWLIPV